MEISLVAAYMAACIIGISLGLIGGGGSILTVPVLVYLFGVEAVTSTAYSLFIVGSTALVGTIQSARKGDIDLRTGIIFAIPSLSAVWLTRAFIIPAIPEVILSGESYALTKDIAILLFFAVIMLLSSYSMIFSRQNGDGRAGGERKTWAILLDGFAIGIVTGLVGAGGGFLIIPALVILAGLPMKKAIGTSLMIIAVKSLIGFTGDIMNPEINFDWGLLLSVTGLAIAGIFIGIRLGDRFSGPFLKKSFGVFILIMGIYMMLERLGNIST